MKGEIKYQDKIKVDFDLIFPPPTDEQLRKRKANLGIKFKVKLATRRRGHVAQLKWDRWIVTEVHEVKAGILKRLADSLNRDLRFCSEKDEKLRSVQFAVLMLVCALECNDMRLPTFAPSGIITHNIKEPPFRPLHILD